MTGGEASEWGDDSQPGAIGRGAVERAVRSLDQGGLRVESSDIDQNAKALEGGESLGLAGGKRQRQGKNHHVTGVEAE